MKSGIIGIEFVSDWHVGEGAGGMGHVDRLVRRDPEDGLPFVPAKTLTGMLRDGCERVARAADGGRHGDWCEFCDRLFGRQSRGAAGIGHTSSAWLCLSAARFAPGLRAALSRRLASDPIRRALCFIKPGVAIDPQTGVALDDMLRMEEVVVAGSMLEAEWQLTADLDEETTDAALVLLAAGCAVTDRIGGKRRRGSGRCRLRLNGANTDVARLRSPPPASSERIQSPPELRPTQGAGSGAPLVCALDLELLAPVIVPAQTLGNVVETRDHIPGALLLPALDAALRRALGARGGELTALLAAGRVQVRNAYPIAPDGSRALPAPFALEAEKERPDRIRNRFFGPPGNGTIQYKPIRDGFLPEAGLPLAQPGRSPVLRTRCLALTHATIDDGPQRPTSDVGGVYTYFALAPGQRLRAELWLEAGLIDSVEALCQHLPGELRIGRAKKDDYGRIRLSASPTQPRPMRLDDSVVDATLWLVSPLLARDARLAPIVEAGRFADALAQELGVGVSLIDERCRAHREEGWISAWREPRPSRIGLAAGSCLKLAFDRPLPWRKIAELELRGFGERRGEGYGELRFDAPLLTADPPPLLDTAPPRKDGPPASTLTPDEFTWSLHQRAWRQVIRDFVQREAGSIAKALGWNDAKPSNSQLGALRSQFEGWTGHEACRQRFRQWWEHLLTIEKRREQWPPLGHDIIASFGSDPDAVWRALAAAGLAEDDLPCLPGHDPGELRRRFAPEATRIYWLGVIGSELDRRLRSGATVDTNAEATAHGA